MYQYQLYPSGNPTNFVPIVNSASGVSAIQDRRMGITEHSLSGVAYYIKAICDYVNQNNVGLSGLPITSGYFNYLGYTWFYRDPQLVYPFNTTIDGIISGVSTVYSSGVSIYDTTPDIKTLQSSSGQFNNVFFDDGFKGSCICKNFIYTGNIKNLYSGYMPTDVSKRLASTQQVISSAADYPFDLGSSGILNDIIVRYRIDSSNNEFGLVQGMLSLETLYVNNLVGINVSGNMSVYGLFKPNLTAYSITTPTFCESLFQIRSHRHDGISSARVTFSDFNSVRAVNDHFSLIQTSGNLTIGKEYKGNNIGLSSNWEVVDLPNIDNVQRLLTCKDKLYVLDNTKLIELDTGKYVESTTGYSYPRAQVIGTSTGDKPALIEYFKGRDYYLANMNDLENINYIRITPFGSEQTYDLGFKYEGIANTDFGKVTSRKELPLDRGVRIGSKLYITLMETIIPRSSTTPMSVLTLYEINTISKPMSLKAVAHYELQGSDWRFIKPIRFKNSIYYFIKGTSEVNYTQYVVVYNTIYRPTQDVVTLRIYGSPPYSYTRTNKQVFEQSQGRRFGFNVFEDTMYAYVESTGLQYLDMVASPLYKIPAINDYTYFLGKPHVMCANGYVGTVAPVRFSSLSRNRIAMFSETSVSNSTSIIEYAGRLWRGNALHVSKDIENRDTTYPLLLSQLNKLTGLNIPWLMLPIVYRGWLYAIAPTKDIVSWGVSHTATSLWKINEYLPAGCLVVRRRSAETEISRMQAYTL